MTGEKEVPYFAFVEGYDRGMAWYLRAIGVPPNDPRRIGTASPHYMGS